MSIYGYCRISTSKQSIDRQIRNIHTKYPDAHIIQEVYTGTKFNGRNEWEKLYRIIKKGDIIIFDSVSRMSRNADEGFKLYQKLFKMGVELIFIKEPHINTSTYKKALESNIQLTGTKTDIILKAINEYLMELAKEQIKVAFEQSEKEVTDLRYRTKEGIQTAKLNGKQIGQKNGVTLSIRKKEPIKRIIFNKSRDFNGSNSDVEVIAILDKMTIKVSDNRGKESDVSAHVSRNTYYKYKREIIYGCKNANNKNEEAV